MTRRSLKAGMRPELNYPFPTENEKAEAMARIEAVAKNADIAVIDGLAGGVLPEFIATLSKHMPVVSLLHHPLCLETGVEADVAAQLQTLEQQGLQFVSHVITTSPQTKRSVNSLFDFPLEKISSVLPGVDRDRISVGSANPKKHLLCIGSIIERKGHKFLIEALSGLQHLDWHLDCIGAMDFDIELSRDVQRLVSDNGLAERITFHGSVSDEVLRDAYYNADLFILPSLYEGYGMVYAEAIVRGLPVIGTTAGAIPDTVPETCGILVEPANAHALANAIEKMLSKPDILAKYKRGAIAAEADFPTWPTSAKTFYEILETLT